LPWADQDALNAVVENWHELDGRWNFQPINVDLSRRRLLVDPAYRERWSLYFTASVLHFVGATKPWSPYCTTAGTGAWARALLRSGWYSPREARSWLLASLRARARRRLAEITRRG
jgi:lipopolysaccharide biosynthesis glycosyltransferase